LIQEIKSAISKAFAELYDHNLPVKDVKIELTNPSFKGSFTFVVFPFLRITRQTPEDSAKGIGDYVQKEINGVADYNVVKGFLNFEIADSYWIQFASEFAQFEHLYVPSDDTRKVMVEYSSPNTNKPLHLGHVRNNLLGYSICQILEYAGNDVVKVNLINDRGIHICKSMLAYERLAEGETPESSGVKGDHLVGKYYVLFDKKHKEELAQLVQSGKSQEEAEKASEWMNAAREMLTKWEANDPEIRAVWGRMNQWVYNGFDVTYERMGVSFDKFYKESDTYLLGKEMVLIGLSDGIFFKKEDGSIWVDLTDEGLDQKLLLRADGTSVYMTQDIGTADLKYSDYKMDQSVYVVGNEQDYHFNVLKLILKKLGKPYADGVHHMSYGMVELPSGKLKTREGKVVDADDLMDEMHETAKQRTVEQGKIEGLSDLEQNQLFEMLGLGALRYFLLKVDPAKRIVFNPEDSIDFQGDTGTFIQYTHARCRSIERAYDGDIVYESLSNLDPTEQNLIEHFYQFQSMITEAARNMSPAVVASYLYETAKRFNSFYNQCSILKAESTDLVSFRVGLTQMTSRVLRECGNLLGMEMPERM